MILEVVSWWPACGLCGNMVSWGCFLVTLFFVMVLSFVFLPSKIKLFYYSFGAVNQFPPLVLQSGFCKPPPACGYNYVNPILWISLANPMADPDCYLWSNDLNQLCYNCNACKASLLGKKEWKKVIACMPSRMLKHKTFSAITNGVEVGDVNFIPTH